MRKPKRKAGHLLNASFCTYSAANDRFDCHPATCTTLNAGWITVRFGWDEKGCEFVAALAGRHTFLLCTEPQSSPTVRKPCGRSDWVYAVDSIPPGFADQVPPNRIQHGGYELAYGRDHAGRKFLSMGMPGRDLTLLFRDPASSTRQAWSPRRAIAVDNAMVIYPHDNAAILDLRKAGDATGDADLDRLLTELA
jgi:hypothetical protein